MTLTLIPMGGFGEVGRNCLGLDINGKIIIIDMGINLEKLLQIESKTKSNFKPSIKKLMKKDALPKIDLLNKRRKDVVAIICSHAHLDHIAAIPYFYKNFNCQIHTTPFTAEVIRSISSKTNLNLNIKTHKSNDKFNISGINVEFIPVAHSTPDAILIAIHTSIGIILYANDFKFDENPIIGNTTDENLLSTYKNKIKLLFLDSLYSGKNEYCKSEATTREKLLSLELKNNRAIFATTFSSHIARLLSLCDLAKKHKREIIFMGSSMSKYIRASKNSKILDLEKRGKILSSKIEILNFLSQIKDYSKYFFIVTGHQGETNAVLSKTILPNFKFKKDDLVIFSNTVIPAEICIENRTILEQKLKNKNVQIIKDIHTSGHLYAKDHQKFLKLISPEIVIPSHGDELMTQNMLKTLQKLNIKGINLKTGEKLQF